MRRKDREITNLDDIIAIIETCDICRIALNDQDYPYILPLNFGMAVKDNTIELYFHGAMTGKKYDLIQQNNKASFEMDRGHRLATDTTHGNCSMEYESVVGQGHIEILSQEEAWEALHILMKHYRQEDFPFNKAMVPKTKTFKLVVEQVSGKARR